MYIYNIYCGHFTTTQHTADHNHTATGWRRLAGCLKLQVTFRKRAINYSCNAAPDLVTHVKDTYKRLI